MSEKQRAPRNRTLVLTEEDRNRLGPRLRRTGSPLAAGEIADVTFHQDLFELLPHLPSESADLIFADPPYNLTKSFNGSMFRRTEGEAYEAWLESWLVEMRRLLKSTGSIYVCGDWRSSSPIQRVLERHFLVRNRITWEREKGRGARANWKNNTEDVWFATASDEYAFNLEDVKVQRRVIAPYKDPAGRPKDWRETTEGRFRATHPSNIWTDLTVPFWSMSENTDHPTQKPEKLLARVILASSKPGDLVFDPFLGSGSSSVVAKKLGRRYCGVEIDHDYCCLAARRLEIAEDAPGIQGYADGVFWERNTSPPRDNSPANRRA